MLHLGTTTSGPLYDPIAATISTPTSRLEQSQQRPSHLPFNPIWGDTCGPLSGKTILGAPYPDGRYVLRDIGRRNYHV